MSLIKCPDCGNTVSSRATVCVHCGCPLQPINYNARIKMPPKPKSSIRYDIIKLFDAETGKLLFKTVFNDIIELKVTEPTRIRFYLKSSNAKILYENIFLLTPAPDAKYQIILPDDASDVIATKIAKPLLVRVDALII